MGFSTVSTGVDELAALKALRPWSSKLLQTNLQPWQRIGLVILEEGRGGWLDAG